MADEPTPDAEPSLDEPTVYLKPIPVLGERPESPESFYVLGTDLICQTENGPLELSLRIKTRLQGELEDKSPREQLYIVLRSHGRDDQVEAIEDLDLVDSREIVRKYWQAFGERNEARLGESLELVAFVEDHRAAIRLDFRRLGLSIDDIGSSLPYREADELLDELRIEWGTHTHASENKLLFPMTYGEYLQLLLTRRVVAFLSSADAPPAEIVTPWRDAPQVADVTDEERARLEAELVRRSAKIAKEGADDV